MAGRSDREHQEALRWRWDGLAWIAPSGSSGRPDLAIMPGPDTPIADLWSDDPPPSGAVRELLRLSAISIELKEAGAGAVCHARQSRLNWKAGPPVECWTLLEIRLDANGSAWLLLHEYETDEYSRWLVRLGTEGQPEEVRRAPALPMTGSPGETGVAV